MHELRVQFAKRMNNASIAACYASGLLEFNMQRLGRKWFRDGANGEVDELLIHEFAHHFVRSHCQTQPCNDVPTGMFYDACCVVGARLKRLALEKPEMFKQFKAAT